MDDKHLSEMQSALVSALQGIAKDEHPEERADALCKTLNTFANAIHRIAHENDQPASRE